MTIATLRDFIAKHESGGDYNIVWGGIRKADYPPKPLIRMTIREVLAWQDRIDPKYRSEAAGKYQIMEDTLRPLWKEAGLTLDSLFDQKGQDALADALLRRRGLVKYLEGKISAETFANNLAHEWASLPMVTGPKKGRSVYAGDGLNAALVSVGPFMAEVVSLKSAPKPQTVPAQKPVAQPALFGAILALIAAVAAYLGFK